MNWLNRLRKRKQQQGAKLRPVHVDSSGARHYAFANPLDAPMSRGVAAEAALRMAEWGLSKKRLADLVEAGKKSLASGDAFANAAAWHEIEVGLTSVAEEDALLDVAAVLTVEEGEPLEYDALIARAKTARWAKSPADRDFFLQLAWPSLRQYETYSDIDIVNYLIRITPKMRRLPHEMKRLVATLRKSTSQHSGLRAGGSLTNKPSSGSASANSTPSWLPPSPMRSAKGKQ